MYITDKKSKKKTTIHDKNNVQIELISTNYHLHLLNKLKNFFLVNCLIKFQNYALEFTLT